MFDMIKTRCGIAKTTKVYDDDIQMYINDCLLDMRDSGVPQKTVEKEDERVITAVTLYVKAHLGNEMCIRDRIKCQGYIYYCDQLHLKNMLIDISSREY